MAYKQGTDTLRRSPAVVLARQLSERGCLVVGFDPAITQSPAALVEVTVAPTLVEAITGVDAVVILTSTGELETLDARSVISVGNPLVVDPGGHLHSLLANHDVVRYRSVGAPREHGPHTREAECD
jgi:UDPglucose 6-dehydrogenase